MGRRLASKAPPRSVGGSLVAWLRPDCHVVLVERKEFSARHGQRRIDSIGLANCEFFCGGVEEFAALVEGGDAISVGGPVRVGETEENHTVLFSCAPQTAQGSCMLGLCVNVSAYAGGMHAYLL